MVCFLNRASFTQPAALPRSQDHVTRIDSVGRFI